MRSVLVALIRAYRYCLSPWWGRSCRFEPTCSAYAIEAIERHGAVKGGLFASRRLLCCHPWHHGGFDPVP
jgi:putative membrane protein insertion efficiency factor